MAAVLEFENLSRDYRGFFGGRTTHALAGLSLSVEAGEILGFLGPNGAGKTTALHIAMGLLRPTSGAGRMLGKPFGDAPTRSRVGFLAENVALYHRPAGKLVRFYGALNGMREPELSARAREVLETVELSAEASRNVGKFSRGMLQRAGLAQALVNDPELLILDEPTSALDPLGRVAVRELLLSTRTQGKTIFLSSHLLSEVELICDRVAILHRGRVAKLGTMAELLQSGEQAEVVARGIDAMKFGGEAADGVVKLRVMTSAQRATIERVWAAGGEIVSVNPARRSLEDLFVELTRQEGSDRR